MFTKEIYWQLQLLLLLDQQDDWYSGTELAYASGLNINTVQKYLDHLQILTQNFPDVTLEKHRNYGARLIRKPIFPLQRLLREVIHQGILVPFFEDLLLLGSVDIQFFCEEHFISLSTLRRNLHKLEKELKPLGLELSKGMIVRLTGPEHQVRYLFFQYLWTIYRGVKEFPWEIEERMNYPIEQLSNLFGLNFSNVQRSQLAVLLFVFECRIKVQTIKKWTIEPTLEAPSLFSHWHKNDWGMLLFFLTLFPVFFELSERKLLVVISPNVQALVADQSDEWIQLFEETFDVTVEEKDIIKGQLKHLLLFNQCLTEVHSLTGLFPIVDEEHLKLIVPQYMEIFSLFSGKFLAECDVRNPKMTELFSLLLANTIVPYLSYRPKIKLFILSDLGTTFEKMQKDLLVAGLSNEYRLEFVKTEAEADLTLSNMPTHYAKSLQIRSTINSRDLRLIRQALKTETCENVHEVFIRKF